MNVGGEPAPAPPARPDPAPGGVDSAREAARARVFFFGALGLAIGLVVVLALEGDELLDGLDDYLILALAAAAAASAYRALSSRAPADLRRANDRATILLASAALVQAVWIGVEIHDAVDVGDDGLALMVLLLLVANRLWP